MSNEPVRITPTDDGPLEVEGAVSIRKPDGTVIRDANNVYLCRCGLSARKPFCDGSHSRQGWRA
jgi:CDGSH-type Zn-finger protein